VNQETVEDLEEKLQHIRTTVATQNDLFTILKKSINKINFEEFLKTEQFKNEINKIFTLSEVEKNGFSIDTV
jgi:hypothetical protein